MISVSSMVNFQKHRFSGIVFQGSLRVLLRRGVSLALTGGEMCRSVKESHDRRCLLRLLGMGIIYSDMRYLMLDSWR